MDDQPKTRQEKKGQKTKEVFNQKTIRLKEALLEKRKDAKPKK
jgi:hypothetical protein